MSAVAECPLCHAYEPVPEYEDGTSQRCSLCGHVFALSPRPVPTVLAAPVLPAAIAPADPGDNAGGRARHPSAAAFAPVAKEGPVPPKPVPITPAAVALARPPLAGSAPPKGHVASPPAPAKFQAPNPVGLAVSAREPDARLWGAAVLGLAGMALLCGSVAPLRVLTLPLSGAGLLLGVAVVVWAWRRRKPCLMPATGAAVNGAALLAAVLFPGLLGPDYRAYRTPTSPDTAVHVVPLPGPARSGPLPDPEWVDAGRAALQQNNLRVQVVGVTLGPVGNPAASQGTKVPADHLVVRLRVRRAGSGRQFAGGQWQAPPARGEKPRLTLTDSTGKVCQPLAIDLGPDGAGDEQASSVFPVAVADEVFVFEAPAPGAEPLRLEVPTAAWGGSAVFRFTIPQTLIRRASAPVGRGGS